MGCSSRILSGQYGLPVCGFAKIHSESTFFVLSRCCRRIMAKSRSIGSGFAEPSVFVSSTFPEDCDLLLKAWPVELKRTCDFPRCSFLQLDKIVLNVGLGDSHQCHC